MNNEKMTLYLLLYVDDNNNNTYLYLDENSFLIVVYPQKK